MERAKFKAAIITMKDTDIYRDHQLRTIIRSVIEKTKDKSSFKDYKNILNQIEAYVGLNTELIQALTEETDYDSLLEKLAEASIAVLSIQEIFNISDLNLKKAITVKIQERL